MKPQEVLTKAIEKARENGWVSSSPEYDKASPDDVLHALRIVGLTDKLPREDWYSWGITNDCAYQKLIYSHDFAKALWGDNGRELICPHLPPGLKSVPLDSYKYHLQQMVVSPDPIKYLEDNL